MSEYVTFDQLREELRKKPDLVEVVRCRDCKFADWDALAWWCIRDKYQPFKIGKLKEQGERSHLNGFCAWGEVMKP